MAYIGQGIKQGTFKVLDTSGNTYNGSNTTFSLGTQVGAAAQLLVSHDGVIQKPGTDYTLASGGASITFSTAPASGASIFITEISGAVGGTVTPSDTSVTADKLNTALLTGHTDIGAAIADADLFLDDDGAGGTLRKTAASRIKTYAGFSVADITGATALDATPADTDEFIISDAGTLKRIDYSYIKSTGEPFFSAQEASTTSFSDASKAQVEFDTEDFDSGGCYNNTGSTVTLNGVSAPAYSFAPNVAGKYFFAIELQCYNSGGQLGNAIAYISKNGTDFVKTSSNFSGSGPFVETITGCGIAELDGTDDYVTGHVYMDVGTGTPQLLGGTGSNMFMGFKIS